MNTINTLPAFQQQELMKHFEEKQVEESLSMYNRVVATCFNECVQSFRSKKMDSKEEGCVAKCTEKFVKHTQRVATRFQEAQAAAMEGQ
jgi:import inner membrane translocase subunit TIM9